MTSNILNTAMGAAPFAIPTVRANITAAVQAEERAASCWINVAETLAQHGSFRSLIAPGGKLGVVGAEFESLNDDEAFTAGLLTVLAGMAAKPRGGEPAIKIDPVDAEGNKKSPQAIKKERDEVVQTLRYVIEDCARSPEADDKGVWDAHKGALYSKLAQLRNRIWLIQDPVTCAFFAKGTGAPSDAVRNKILGDPANAERIKKYAEIAQKAGQAGKGSRGGKAAGNKRAKTVTAITKESDPVEILMLVDQLFGSEYAALDELSIIVGALKDEIAAKKAASK